ncbi:MAG: branched-chain amino acid ABC transporter permease, partial [Chloroflexota bacterium]
MDLPCGTRNFSYATDMAIFRTRTQWAMLVLFLAFVFTAPLYWNGHWLGIANIIGITVIAATGLNILTGYCGQLSVGHAGFIAVGGYTAAILMSEGVPFLAAMLCAGLVAGLVGVIFGLPSLRVKGFYLAITTIAAQLIIIFVINHWTGLTGGYTGIRVPVAEIAGIRFITPANQYFLIMAVAV